MSVRIRSARGFSLVEMMLSLLISAIVIAGAVGLMIGTQRHFESTSDDRYLQETARVALGHIANNLRMAGYGVDPSLAFDFGRLTNAKMDRAYGNAAFSTTSFTGQGTVGSCSGLCRDSTTSPDEIVFLSRDPSFGPHPLTVAPSPTDTSLTVAGRVSLQAGQILQILCYKGSGTWAYVQVNGTPVDNGNGTSTIPIASGATTFPRQNDSLADSCFGSVATVTSNTLNRSSLLQAAEVFKVDRYRYFINAYDATGAVQPWGTAGTRPFLMLDQGLIDSSGRPVITPLVPDVEDLQFAYIFPYDAVTPIVGATPGTSISNDDSGINLAPAGGGPVFTSAPGSAARLNHHPGNIGAVRLSLVVRSSAADIRLTTLASVPAAGNRSATAGPVGYVRLLVDTTVAVPNLATGSLFYPPYNDVASAPSGGRQVNVGGG